MKIILVSHSSSSDDDSVFSSPNTYTNPRSLSPRNQIKSKLENLDVQVLMPNKVAWSEADVAVFLDLQKSISISIPDHIPCILICNGSFIDTPLSHKWYTLFRKRWKAVLTWNRSFQAPNIFYYDIPFFYDMSAEEVYKNELVFNKNKSSKGVTFSSYRKDKRGLLFKKNWLYLELTKGGYIDLYGSHWTGKKIPNVYNFTPNKIDTMIKYTYSIVVEDSLCSGYVTKQLADSIFAGIPAIYYGDFTTAERRFPGCFIKLKDLSVDAFFKAQEELLNSHDKLQNNVLTVRKQFKTWGESFLDLVEKVVIDLD